MRKIQLLALAILFTSTAFSQRVHVGVFGGLAAYNGDLTEKIFPKKTTNGAIGITLNYELQERITLRGGLTYAIVGGADRFSDKEELKARNLAFETKVLELSALGEYYLFNMRDMRWSPYLFAGIAVYRFNPYAFQPGSNEKVFLRPLSTEGQGVPGYSASQPYSLTQAAIPFGGGVKFAVNDNIHVGVELGLRKLFTDHLDDVSGNYIDATDLLNARGQLAVDMAYRGDEVPGGDPTFPLKDAQRGSPKAKDYYYFSGIHLTYRLGAGSTGAGKRNRTGCPTNIY